MKKTFMIIIMAFLMLFNLCGCSNNTTSQNDIWISNQYSFEGEYIYFDTPYKYTTYRFMLNYVYTEDEACSTYGFKVTNKYGVVIYEPSILINGMGLSTSQYPYLIKGSTISAIIDITSSALPMKNSAPGFKEFTVELCVGLNDNYTVLATAEFTFEKVKQMCLPK